MFLFVISMPLRRPRHEEKREQCKYCGLNGPNEKLEDQKTRLSYWQ